ncbi:hypothetical protein EXIGLDRAFT_734215 [Exidia glandulosa HHB12029]|uniref:F-box domain-containing protein n=1 Tax=Exidia glandulosa HHB12029 TaxID=1314781 RepID=A0A165K7T1_EXIGL|nr:hypothetical protein EXIGLDRAFT_734215 [Exidia glandulosa HHB12029]
MSLVPSPGSHATLRFIFEHLWTDDGSLEAAVLVSKSWRKVGTESGKLWTVFNLRLVGPAPPNIATFLARSRGYPVDITVSFGTVTTSGSPDDRKTRLYHAHCLTALCEHLPHTRRLVLRTAPGIVLPPAQVTDLLMSRADVLELLHWDLAFPPVLPHNVFQATASRLTVVEARPSQLHCVHYKCSCAVHAIARRATNFSPLHYDSGFQLQSLFRTFENLQTLTLGAPLPTAEQAPDIAALGQKLKRLVIFDSPGVAFDSTLVLLGHAAVKAITIYNATSRTMKRLRQSFHELQLDPASNRDLIVARTRVGLERIFVSDDGDDDFSVVQKDLLEGSGLQRLTVKSSYLGSRSWLRDMAGLAQSSQSNTKVLLSHLTIVISGDADDPFPHVRSILPHERISMHELDTLCFSRSPRFDDIKHELAEEPNATCWLYGDHVNRVFDRAIETRKEVFGRLELDGIQLRPTVRYSLSQISRDLAFMNVQVAKV